MTEQELKEKIMEIIDTSVDLWASKNKRGQIQVHIDKLADALIAAGLDFDHIEFHYVENKYTETALRQKMIKEYESCISEWKHRAQVAEKIAKEACEIVFCEEIDNEEWDEVIWNYKETKEKYSDEFVITDEMLYDYLHEQAEKELREERKNE